MCKLFYKNFQHVLFQPALYMTCKGQESDSNSIIKASYEPIENPSRTRKKPVKCKRVIKEMKSLLLLPFQLLLVSSNSEIKVVEVDDNLSFS